MLRMSREAPRERINKGGIFAPRATGAEWGESLGDGKPFLLVRTVVWGSE
jgi:hypothetical protein